MKARVVICGSRGWADNAAIFNLLVNMDPASAIIVTGAARGADGIAAGMALEMGFEVEQYPADWERYGRSAGFRRNQEMLRLPNVCQVIAFWDGKSRGTWDTLRRAKALKIRTEIYKPAGMNAKRTPDQGGQQ